MSNATAAEIEKALYGRRRSKYNVGPPETRMADGIVFDSIRERDRYLYLKLLVRAGTIRDLELQPRFPLCVNGIKVCAYVADFRYFDRDGREVIEDVKGAKTPVYRLKQKLFEACFPHLRILEV